VKRVSRIVLIVVIAPALVTAASFIPALRRKTAGMQTLQGGYVRVNFQREPAAAGDVFRLAEDKAAVLTA
jgi:hypothetical protein